MTRAPADRITAFTLVEILVSMAVLVLLLAMIMQIFNGAAAVTTSGNKSMDADAQARALLDRMDIDIAAMVKRQDVDYYLKGRPASNAQDGNDQMAFYSEVPGYYPSTGAQSPISVVAYRLNSSTYKMERLGIGLVWNADSSGTNTAVVFLPVPLASPLPSPLPSPTPAWPQAASPSMADPDYETFGPDVFRFEYYYVLKGQDVTTNPSILSDTPWDTRSPASHTSLNGLQDVAAIGVVIAVIDPKSRLLVSGTQLATLASQMSDFKNTGLLVPSKPTAPGDLESQWQAAVNASGLPHTVISAIRIYGRTFYLNASTP